jgi:hypothetical protein
MSIGGWTIAVPVKLIHAIGAKGVILVTQLFHWSGKQHPEVAKADNQSSSFSQRLKQRKTTTTSSPAQATTNGSGYHPVVALSLVARGRG